MSTRAKPTSEFVAYLAEVFEGFGPIQAKRMFGGYGIYRDALMFALVADDVLYLKTDETLAAELAALGRPPFEYTKQGKRTQTSYYMAPAGIYDDPETAKRWAERAYAVAVRARQR